MTLANPEGRARVLGRGGLLRGGGVGRTSMCFWVDLGRGRWWGGERRKIGGETGRRRI